MHVLILPSWYPRFEGDAEGSFFRDQAQGLAELGLQVGVAFADLRGPRQVRRGTTGGVTIRMDGIIQEVRSHGFNWFPRIYPGFERLWLRHISIAVNEYVTRFGHPDIVHAHSMEPAAVAAEKISREFGIPFVTTEHSTAHILRPVSSSKRSKFKRLAARSSSNLAVSEMFAEALNESYGGNWHYQPNIVASRFFTAPLVRREGATTRLVTVGYLTRRKRVDLIIEAVAFLRKRGFDVALTIVGDGPERGALTELVKGLGVLEHVEFVGQVSIFDMPTAMSRGHILVSASEFETFGVTLIEGMALGMPIVATRSGGPNSIVKPNLGRLVDEWSVEALAEAIAAVVVDFADYPAKEIRDECASVYSTPVVCAALDAIYQRACGDAR
ncbi:glycosyltransferase [Altererythrobacter arenosus]|uniref:Glycosyltransferase n=1 Tax=Altererythrobacter arenosus TaxID=3032592 RepID=A0ABY8G1T6_9SPHN|nr:glycosyltransferase [Altererythrobacter sp. CAU 1644]WFL78709.1 glycosyltransferase [Altererythrobacter sp. CAU 1644]